MRILLTIEYDGTNYSGWQTQKNAVSIQETVEEAILRATGERVRVTGAGRTDAGVHALAQKAHFDTNSTIPPDKMSYALNLVLPADIRIRESREVPDWFHAMRSAKTKHYRYVIYNDEHDCAINRNYCCFVRQNLDIAAMSKAASYFKGEHDFAAFCAQGSTPVATTVRTISECTVEKIGNYINIDVYGNGFLYNMVRIISGTLIDVGKKRKKPEDIPNIILSKDRNNASATAPAKGLVLVSVIYG